jgi:large subunit ribosomal protein L5
MRKEDIRQIEKVVVNAGIGKLSALPSFEEKVLPDLIKELAIITGQKPASRGARQSISGFKLRTGTVVGLVTTLRGARMGQFLDRLRMLVLPRMRDFRGLSLKNIDSGGNLNIGIRETVVFPEINPEFSKANFGLQITVVPREKNREKALAFYRKLEFPLVKS